MLQPANRQLLTDLLQPPKHYELLQAVGTTFTLDLSTALTVPLAFAASHFDDSESSNIGIIAALSKQTDRITIFSQAGEIRAGVDSELVTLLEQVIYTVQPPMGIFHPKIWLLEYGKGEKRKYRLLNFTRNLTEDRSWDLAVRLDGEPAQPEELNDAAQRNEPLVNFVQQLPELVTQGNMPATRRARLQEFAEQLRQVRWEHPAGVSDVQFHVLGMPAHSSGAERRVTAKHMLRRNGSEALVVSPFLTKQAINDVLRMTSQDLRLVSRPESFDRLGPLPNRVHSFVLDELTHEAVAEETSTDYAAAPLHGLHAKAIFLRERRNWSYATALIGSANVTSGGFYHNVECMFELRGSNHTIGPKAVADSMASMLQSYTPEYWEEESDPISEAQETLDQAIRELAATRFFGRVGGHNPYRLSVWASEQAGELFTELKRQNIAISWGLLTGQLQQGLLPVGEAHSAQINHLRLGQITPFLRINLSHTLAGETVRASSIVHAELYDDVPDRLYKVIAGHIGDGDTFLKLLALLLNPAHFGYQQTKALLSGKSGNWSAGAFSTGLFESLLKALAQGDEGLDHAQKVFLQLQHYAGDTLELPDGFERLWENILTVRTQQLETSRA